MDSFSGIKVEKLGEDNFHTWKQKVELLLALRDLDEHLTSKPPENAEELASWKKRDRKARAIIGLTISDEHLDHVRDIDTAADVWRAICNVFQRKTLLNRINSRRSFYTAKMREDEKMLQFVNRIRHLASDMKCMDIKVEEEDVAMAILCNLPERFNNLIVAIDTTIEDRDLTLEFVKSRLLQEEQRMNDRAKEESEDSTALVGQHSRRKSSGPIVCYYCGAKGHIQRNCFKKQRDESDRGQGNSAHAAMGGEKEQSVVESDFVCLIASNSINTSSTSWIVDSGATAHMTFDKSRFQSLEITSRSGVSIGNDSKLEAHGSGSVDLDIIVNGEVRKCRLKNVVYVPQLRYQLLSVAAMCDAGYTVVFQKSSVSVKMNSKLIASGHRVRGLYYLSTREDRSSKQCALISDLSLWHARLAHVNFEGIKKMAKDNVVNGLTVDVGQASNICNSCVIGKATRMSSPKQGGARCENVLDLVHSDVAGPIDVQSMGGSHYFVTFIDDHSRFCFIYLMKTKSEVHEKFLQWVKLVENQTGSKLSKVTGRQGVLKAIRSDNGGEYVSKSISKEMQKRGIVHQRTIP